MIARFSQLRFLWTSCGAAALCGRRPLLPQGSASFDRGGPVSQTFLLTSSSTGSSVGTKSVLKSVFRKARV